MWDKEKFVKGDQGKNKTTAKENRGKMGVKGNKTEKRKLARRK